MTAPFEARAPMPTPPEPCEPSSAPSLQLPTERLAGARATDPNQIRRDAPRYREASATAAS